LLFDHLPPGIEVKRTIPIATSNLIGHEKASCVQVCQIFLGTTNQNGKKCTKIATKTPNGYTIYPNAQNKTYWP
jgi:hypothetical protein